MALGTDWVGEAQDHTAIPTNSYLILAGNRSDFTLTTTTNGEVTVSSVAGSNLYQFGYIDQETIKTIIEGDRKVNIGIGQQEVNTSQMQSLEWGMAQASTLDAKAQQEIEDSELVILVVKIDAVTVTTATLASNGNISTDNMVMLFDHCFVQVSVNDDGGDSKKATFAIKKTNLPVKNAYLAEGILQTIT